MAQKIQRRADKCKRLRRLPRLNRYQSVLDEVLAFRTDHTNALGNLQDILCLIHWSYLRSSGPRERSGGRCH